MRFVMNRNYFISRLRINKTLKSIESAIMNDYKYGI